jgi:probable rRNA maturation factor
MVSIINRQKKIKISVTAFKRDAAVLLRALGYQYFDVTIVLTTNKSIRAYNQHYRHKDKATDILSFPFHNNITPGERIFAQSRAERCLGDIIISLEFVRTDIKKMETSFDERMQRLLVHGICHLIGYDHETDEEYDVMLKKENELLALLV